MKKSFKTLLASIGLGICSSATAESAVVYFTLVHNRLGVENTQNELGNTGRVAFAIADKTASDIFEIRTHKTYSADYDETTEIAKKELENNISIKIKDIPDMSKYSEIYLGYPIWWGTYPQAVKTFLQSQNFAGKTIYSFATHEGSGFGRSNEDLKALLPDSMIIPLIEIRGYATEDSTMLKKIEHSLSKIGK